MSRIPVLPTVIVLIAVGIMVRLGFWQLDRLHQKEAMIARYSAALNQPELDWTIGVPLGGDGGWRRIRVKCEHYIGTQAVGGRNRKGQSGWAHWAQCVTPSGSITVVAGWSSGLGDPRLAAGIVTGVGVPEKGAEGTVRLVADPPLAGLEANARPDPRDLPNNHFSYAVQWFLFAATALIIYAIALWKRARGE